jgi:leader peptidase (prepilin peptidase)/N-methyltransferase
MKPILIIGCGVIGLFVGSFMNVVIERVPRRESIVTPRSRCVRCGTPIANRDNLPLVSWFILRGRCRTCGQPISWRYPLVEFAVAGVFAGVAATFGVGWNLLPFLVLTAGLVALGCIDVERHVLPVRIVYPVLATVAILFLIETIATGQWHRLLVAIACAAAWFALFFAINWTSPRLLGFGDVRFAVILGLGLGWLGVPVVFVGFMASNIAGLIVALALIGTGRMNRETPIPYGVFLALGTLVAVFVSPAIMEHVRKLWCSQPRRGACRADSRSSQDGRSSPSARSS